MGAPGGALLHEASPQVPQHCCCGCGTWKGGRVIFPAPSCGSASAAAPSPSPDWPPCRAGRRRHSPMPSDAAKKASTWLMKWRSLSFSCEQEGRRGEALQPCRPHEAGRGRAGAAAADAAAASAERRGRRRRTFAQSCRSLPRSTSSAVGGKEQGINWLECPEVQSRCRDGRCGRGWRGVAEAVIEEHGAHTAKEKAAEGGGGLGGSRCKPRGAGCEGAVQTAQHRQRQQQAGQQAWP